MEAGEINLAAGVKPVILQSDKQSTPSVLILVPVSQEFTSNNAKDWVRRKCREKQIPPPPINTFFSLDRAVRALSQTTYNLVIVGLSPSEADGEKNRSILTFLDEYVKEHPTTQFIVYGNEKTLAEKTDSSNVTFSLNDHFGKTLGTVWSKL